MNELRPLIDLLTGKFPWMITLLAWMGAARIALKFFSGRIQSNLTRRMAEAAASQDPEDDRDFEVLLGARAYRTTSFVLDLLFSFKLPTLADFQRMLTEHQTSSKGIQ